MVLNRYKFRKKTILQITLTLIGIIILFFTYFNKEPEDKVSSQVQEEKFKVVESERDNINTFENITYEGEDSNKNKFTINAEYAEFTNDKPNIIFMKNIFCRFFFKDGTVLRITSDRGIFDNILNDMEFEDNVKMFYLENQLFADKANFVNSENYLLVQNNVIGKGPQGNLVADKLNVDLVDKKMKISMYNRDKVNIKVNY